MSNSSKEIKGVFYDFYHTTSIHGILYIFKPSYGKLVRFVWLVIFLTTFSLCVTQSYMNVRQYLQFDVQTTTVIQSQKNLQFPSITFCSKYWMRTELIGNSSFAPLNLAVMYSESQQEFNRLVSEISKTCKSNIASKTSQIVEKYGTDDSSETYAAFRAAWEEDVKTMVSTFQSDVVKCWWQGKERECSNMFINRFTDTNYCFTFNTGNKLAKDPTLWKLFGAHGLNVTNYDEKTYDVGNWVRNKLTLLMNVNQKYLCGGSLSSGGVGFEVIFQNKEIPPLNSFDTSIKLRLSHANNVIIKPKSWRRYTEHMGLCKAKVDLFMFPEASFSNIQPVCFLQCAVAKIFRKCGCYPLLWAPLENIFRRNYKKLGIDDPEKTIKPCGRAGTTCVLEFHRKDFIGINYRVFCPDCAQPCFEDKFDFQITYSRLSIDRLKLDITNDSLKVGRSDENLRENFLYVTFGFENRDVEIFKETQAIKLIDLFVFIGGNIGLFLGMSFMSTFEVLIGLMMNSTVILLKEKYNNICRSKKSINHQHEINIITKRMKTQSIEWVES